MSKTDKSGIQFVKGRYVPSVDLKPPNRELCELRIIRIVNPFEFYAVFESKYGAKRKRDAKLQNMQNYLRNRGTMKVRSWNWNGIV